MTTATTTKITRKWATVAEGGFSGPVSRNENPAAHGCVCLFQSRWRGRPGGEILVRSVNVNGAHREVGEATVADDETVRRLVGEVYCVVFSAGLPRLARRRADRAVEDRPWIRDLGEASIARAIDEADYDARRMAALAAHPDSDREARARAQKYGERASAVADVFRALARGEAPERFASVAVEIQD